MCLEMLGARQASGARDSAPPAPSASLRKKPARPSSAGDESAVESPAAPSPRGGAKISVFVKKNSATPANQGAGEPSGATAGEKSREAKSSPRKIKLGLTLALVVSGLLLAWFFAGGSGNETDTRDAEIQEYMWQVKNAVLSIQDSTGTLPDNPGSIEDRLRQKGLNLELLRPPVYLTMNRSAKPLNTILLTPVSDGIEIRGFNAKGEEVTYQNLPIVLTARRKETSLASPTPLNHERGSTDDTTPAPE
jgi:hypothetical protein